MCEVPCDVLLQHGSVHTVCFAPRGAGAENSIKKAFSVRLSVPAQVQRNEVWFVFRQILEVSLRPNELSRKSTYSMKLLLFK